MSKLPKGFMPLGQTPQEALEAMSRRYGGIPGFAKDALKKMGMPEADIEKADKVGKEKR